MTISLSSDDFVWPDAIAVPVDRVIAGNPTTSTIVLHKGPGAEAGLWRVTPGEFSTVHTGYKEVIVVNQGEGDLLSDDGAVLPLHPGSVIVLEDGWSGRWAIRRTLTKSYTTVAS